MASTPKLAQFTFEPSDDARSISIHIEDDKGETLELIATRDQLEVLADSLDDFLAETEEADEVEEDDEEAEEGEVEEDDDDDQDEDGEEGEKKTDGAPRRGRA